MVDGQVCRGLIDAGCSRTLLSPKIKINPNQICAQSNGIILSFSGQRVPHEGEATVAVELAGCPVTVRAVRCGRVLLGVDVIVGMDVLSRHLVMLDRGQLHLEAAAAALSKSCQHQRIGENGFEVTFDGKAWLA